MAGLSVSVPHRLGQQAAQARVHGFLEQVRRDYGHEASDIHGLWSDNRLEFSFVTRGLTVRGTLVVEDNSVHVAGPLPLAALLFRGRIEQQIRQELEKLLA